MFQRAQQSDFVSCFPVDLLVLHTTQPEKLTDEQREQVVNHVAACPRCADLYDVLSEADMELWVQVVEAVDLPKRELKLTRSPEEAVADLWERVVQEKVHRFQRHRRTLIFRVGKLAAMAACVAAVLSGTWLLSRQLDHTSSVASQSDVQLVRNRERQAARQADPRIEADLLVLDQNLALQLKSSAPDTLVYATWRDEHQGWGLRQFSWVTNAQQFLNTKGIQADWIEVLMFSGDIWQFQYHPNQPASQPLARLEPSVIVRLARHYRVDEGEILRAVGLSDSTAIAALPIDSQTQAQQNAQTLRRWYGALASEQEPKSQNNDDLMAFSLDISQYLANSRTAAYLWAKAHPQEVRQLLADTNYREILPMSLTTGRDDVWLNQLLQQTVATRNCEQAALEWFLIPEGNGCMPQLAEQQRKLAALVAELLPSRPEERKHP